MKIVLLYFYVVGYGLVHPLPVVTTPQGKVQGTYKKSYDGRFFSAFEGIPYAKPPVDALRFEEPIAADKWDGILAANTTYMCANYVPITVFQGVKGSEDCLYMYVYVPREKITGNENLDVVVHIHGGAFMIGAPNFMAGPTFIMDKEVVYVSLNYRLAILGFLSTEDDVVPGNNGLKDQAMALKWIKDNIKYFGGNPDSITLTGLSAGGASVHYHYLSPWSKGLFHRGFSQSGAALLPWALTEEPLAKATTVANTIGCPTDSTKIMVNCLKKVPIKKLLVSMKSLLAFMDIMPYTVFGPVVEKGGERPFINEHPYKLLKTGKVYDVPWIFSNVKHEGLFPVGLFGKMLPEFDRRWNELAPYALEMNSTLAEANKLDVAIKIRKYYLQDEPVTKDNVYSLVDLFSDRIYKVDSEKSLRLHAAAVKSPVYYYYFTYLLQMTSPILFGIKKGVAHGDDGRLIFNIIATPSKLKTNDEKMMKFFTEFIEVYAKTNKPSFNGVDWKPVVPNGQDIDYLEIASPNDISMKKKKELAPNEFWNSLPIMENDRLFK